MNKKKELQELPFGLDQKAVNDLFLLQRHDFEFGGLIDKNNKIIELRQGHSASVDIDVEVKNNARFDFHTHPTGGGVSAEFGSKPISKREYQCSVDKELILSETLSPEDVFIAIQYRPLVEVSKMDGNGGKVHSLMVAERKMMEYYLDNKSKYDTFKREIPKIIGGNIITEMKISERLSDIFNKIHNDISDETYRKGGFSQCDDKEIMVKRKEKWNAFLETIGMKIIEKEVRPNFD